MALMRGSENKLNSSNSGGNGMENDPGNWPRMELRPVGVVRAEKADGQI
jgi:hypothetical protein